MTHLTILLPQNFNIRPCRFEVLNSVGSNVFFDEVGQSGGKKTSIFGVIDSKIRFVLTLDLSGQPYPGLIDLNETLIYLVL